MDWRYLFSTAVMFLFVFAMIWLMQAQSSAALWNGECNHFSNSTNDLVGPMPFTDKCLGIKNYIVEEDGLLQVKRGIRFE